MKKTNKGFTIVELIIVIAVIGVLAAILIPTFTGVIEKANAKSALSDARNALSTYLANTSTDDQGASIEEHTVFVVYKAGDLHVFQYELGKLETRNLIEDKTAADVGTQSGCGTVDTDAKNIANIPTHVAIYANNAAIS